MVSLFDGSPVPIKHSTSHQTAFIPSTGSTAATLARVLYQVYVPWHRLFCYCRPSQSALVHMKHIEHMLVNCVIAHRCIHVALPTVSILLPALQRPVVLPCTGSSAAAEQAIRRWSGAEASTSSSSSYTDDASIKLCVTAVQGSCLLPFLHSELAHASFNDMASRLVPSMHHLCL